MEATTTTASAAASPAANLPGGSPATTRDISHTPGPETMKPHPAGNTPNGVPVNNVDVDMDVDVDVNDKAGTTYHTATPVPELSRPASRTPPLLSTQPAPSELPSTQLSSLPSTSTQSPAPPSTQPSPQLPSMHSADVSPSVPPQATPAGMLPRSQQIHQSQFYRWAPSNAIPPSTSAPPPSQAGQSRRQPRETNGIVKRFPSPEVDHDSQVPRFVRDLSLLADTVQQSCPEAVRRIVRDKWEKCIMGSEFHHAFLMNAIIHHASGVIMRRAIRDFGQKMVTEAKHEITAHLGPQDLDDMAPAILEKCSDQFLDRMLEHRLGTIDARSLINALARAERLGYTNSDVLDDRRERVVPTAQMHSPEVRYISSVTASSRSQPPPVAPPQAPLPFQSTQNAPPATDLKCRLCWRQFKHTKAYEYHVAKQLCTKAASDAHDYIFWCENCGAGFTTKGGKDYHTSNAVCGNHTTAIATPRSQATTPMPEVPLPTNYMHHPIHPTQLPPNPSQTYSTPQRPSVDYKGTVGSNSDDPYHHLTPQQRTELDEELRQAELSYRPRFKEAESNPDPVGRKIKLESLQNTFSTKQSMIRKKYGVRLRVRRTRAEIDEERSRLGLKHGPSSPYPAASTPSVKRQRSDDPSNGSGAPSFVSRGPQTQTPTTPAPILPLTNHLSVSQMNNSGLGGSTATVAMTDPTTFIARPSQPPSTEEKPPPSSLSSLQRKGYRVSSHVGQANRPASASPAPRSGSAATPVVLDDSSDDTETDEDIPATLPPLRKVS
ncbi:hypothetical protein F4803DRAFT_303942 [Xylaria telfairii]|nr:hypothetical protein F4803DRAFT_303942 [Xylaria telfairii]